MMSKIWVVPAVWCASSLVGAENTSAESLDDIVNGLQERLDALKTEQQNQLDTIAGEVHTMDAEIAELKEARRLHNMVTDDDYTRVLNYQKLNQEVMSALLTGRNGVWMLLTGCMVFLLQAGLSLIEAGRCQYKNVQAILLRNIGVLFAVTIGWYSFGWAFAFGIGNGGHNEPFLNTHEWFGSGFSNDLDGSHEVTDKAGRWFFYWTVASVAVTIATGGLSERVSFPVILAFAFFLSFWVYPVIVHWTWGYGWLAGEVISKRYELSHSGHINDTGYVDFAGSGVIHLFAGVASLIGALIVGPRFGRHDPNENFAPHNVPMVVLGTYLAWFGFYGVTCGPALVTSESGAGISSLNFSLIGTRKAHLAGHVAMNVTLSAISSALMSMIVRFAVKRRFDLDRLCNGILAGLVAISAGCANVTAGWTILIGIFAGLFYEGSSMLLSRFKLDDPMDTFPVHGICGMWGLFAAAVFDWAGSIDDFIGPSRLVCTESSTDKCPVGKRGEAVGANVVEIIVIFGWTALHVAAFLVPLRLAQVVKYDDVNQEIGLDMMEHVPYKGYDFSQNYAYYVSETCSKRTESTTSTRE